MTKRSVIQDFLNKSQEDQDIIKDYLHELRREERRERWKRIDTFLKNCPVEQMHALENAFDNHWEAEMPFLGEVINRFGLKEFIAMMKECDAELDYCFWEKQAKASGLTGNEEIEEETK